MFISQYRLKNILNSAKENEDLKKILTFQLCKLFNILIESLTTPEYELN